jgi:type I pantothenate kinase
VNGGGPGDSGYEVIPREEWIARGRTGGVGTESEAVARASAGEPVDAGEVREVYLPLARWIEDRMAVPGHARRAADGDLPATVVVGITGSVAAGKTTTARVLAGLLRRGPVHRTVDLLTTDGFLYPNQVLEQRGLLDRKGFPESYDHQALSAALDAVRAGQPEVGVPVYSHESYDIVPDQVQWIRRPDILVVEGLTVLQGALGGGALVDLAIYVDADEASVARWHTERLLALRSDVDAEPSDFQRWFASLSEVEAHQVAASSWSEINLVNLREHVAPTRGQADVILQKDADHRVHRVLLRTGSLPAG